MLYTVCGIVVVSFAIFGIIDFYKFLSLTLYSTKINNSAIIVPIGSDSNQTEFLVRSAIAKTRWLSLSKNQQIICLDCDMNDESKEICRRLYEKYPFISIKTADELKDLFSN